MIRVALRRHFRARDLSPRRQASADSFRQCSIESVLSSPAAAIAATAATAAAAAATTAVTSGHRIVSGGSGRFGGGGGGGGIGGGGLSVHAGLKHAASTSSPPVSPPSTLQYRKKFRMSRSREGSSSGE